MGVVYEIINSLDSRTYVGSSINFNHREKEHFRDLNNGNHHNNHLQRFVDKYGVDTLTMNILEECEDDMILGREQYHIDNNENLFNIATDAQAPMTGKRHTKETLSKISKATKGKNNPMFGKKRPKWLIDKMQANRWCNTTKKEGILRRINAPLRKELIITKDDTTIRCMSYAHAAKEIGAKYQSIESAIKRESYKCKGWSISVCDDRLYTEELVLNNLDKFDTDCSPQKNLVTMLRNL